eukprot:1406199-Pleurochrysis_carterae.AAC.3
MVMLFCDGPPPSGTAWMPLQEGYSCDKHVLVPWYGGLPLLRMFEHWFTTDYVWPDNTLRGVVDLDSHECLVAVTAYPTMGAVDIDVFDMMHNTSLSQRMPSLFASTATHAQYFVLSVSSLLDPWYLPVSVTLL